MKRYILFSVCAMMAGSAIAQDTYESARMTETDLNGTARYVGMGGAMEALGADISTISSNPAGIGMFRHSKVSGSFGVVSQQDAKSFASGNKTNMSFDQAGFVYAMRNGRNSWLNFAFNYSKSRNFNHILTATGSLNESSQNKLSYIKLARGSGNYGFDAYEDNDGYFYSEDKNFTQTDYLYLNTLIPDNKDNSYRYNDATGYTFGRANKGYIGRYDFNLSGNINNRVFLGVTFGLSDVHYKNYSSYTESIIDEKGASMDVTLNDERRITGTGFDVKAGIIFRPVETSPFRVGLYVSTPTWYTLSTTNYTTISMPQLVGVSSREDIGETYDFRLNTPWKFGASLGHTVGDYLALGLTYEYTDLGALDNRIKTYNYGYDYSDSYSDEVANAHTKNVLRGTHTLKVGGELKATKDLAVRLGYNYVSPGYKKKAFRDLCLDSYGSYYASTTDYTNWKATNRLTAGLGYTLDGWNFDLAYQYSCINGDFYPFSDNEGVDIVFRYDNGTSEAIPIVNQCSPTKVSNKRHQLLFTVGYTF